MSRESPVRFALESVDNAWGKSAKSMSSCSLELGIELSVQDCAVMHKAPPPDFLGDEEDANVPFYSA